MSVVGHAVDRADGPIKVLGAARYAGEQRFERLAHAVAFVSTAPSGRLLELDSRAAKAQAGVLEVLSVHNTPEFFDSSDAGDARCGAPDYTIQYSGQLLGIVVAERRAIARHAASLIEIRYAASEPLGPFEKRIAEATAPHDIVGQPPDSVRGNIDLGLGQAAARVSQTYTTPRQHHLPIEPHAAVAVWTDDHLTLYTATQMVVMTRARLAEALGLDAQHVRVVSPFVGGGFGSKGGAFWPSLILLAMAARRVARPVKLVLTRDQMFTLVGHRQPTLQQVTLGATAEGQLTAIVHNTVAPTAMQREYSDGHGFASRLVYACPNVAISHRLVRTNVAVSNPMRAPGEATGTFALESALDELAERLQLDPVDLRLRNIPPADPHTGRPWSSHALRQCYELGAERFGWWQRSPQPLSMRHDGQRVGFGVATSTYPANRRPTSVRLRMERDGRVLVQCASHDIGTGTYTVLAQVAADALEIPFDQVRVELGDSELPAAPPSVGSMTVASMAPAVRAAALEAQARREVDHDPVEVVLEFSPGAASEQYSSHAFGAHFVEVRVDPMLGEVRVARMLGVYGAGRILNPKLARSQLIGGMVFGVGLALMEAGSFDARLSRMVGTNLADYHLPVQADMPHAVDVVFLDEVDQAIDDLGAKGIGMLGNVGLAPAIANAVYHATGRRIRNLPITPDKLLH